MRLEESLQDSKPKISASKAKNNETLESPISCTIRNQYYPIHVLKLAYSCPNRFTPAKELHTAAAKREIGTREWHICSRDTSIYTNSKHFDLGCKSSGFSTYLATQTRCARLFWNSACLGQSAHRPQSRARWRWEKQ
jgi:hypothetical protein